MKVSSIVYWCVIIGLFINIAFQIPNALEIEEQNYQTKMSKISLIMEGKE